MSYYNVGKNIIEAQGGEERAKYGNQLIKKYSEELMREINKKYSYRNVMYMRRFYILFKNEIMNALRSHLSWTHFRELLPLKDINAINYYIEITKEQNLGYRQLHERIKQKEYERLPESAKNKLIKKEETTISDYIKDPIYIQSNNKEIISEKILMQLIIENISSFLKQLGPGFTYVDNEYKIKMGNQYNYIDILLFNIKFSCYVVIELKVTALKKKHIGQVEIYKNYIDEHLKTINQNETIGIIIYKEGNKLLLHYCTDKKIHAIKYITI